MNTLPKEFAHLFCDAASEPINIKIRLNVDESIASELYDEIEAHLALCFESIMERKLSTNFDKIASPAALTGFLIEKLGNPSIKVEHVETLLDYLSGCKNVFVSIFVPNVWAANYGKETSVELEEALEFFKNPKVPKVPDHKESTVVPTNEIHTTTFPMMNGLPVNPIVGAMCYDQLLHKMRYWTGTAWVTQW